jgi:SAM-dependent methyltransferase
MAMYFPLRQQLAAWAKGFDFEVEFWTNWIQSRGAQWPGDFVERLDPNTSIDGDLERIAISCGRPAIDILDVGAGPLTTVGKQSIVGTINLVPCDPLAGIYSELLATFGIKPPVETEFAIAEDLSSFFGINKFDIIHCVNALDHSFDPIRSIFEMLRVVREGGHIVLRHSINEAETLKYEGFHQFNFDEENGRFIIWNRESRLCVDEIIKDPISVRVDRAHRWIVVDIRKEVPSPLPTIAELQNRVASMMRAVVEVYGAEAAIRLAKRAAKASETGTFMAPE